MVSCVANNMRPKSLSLSNGGQCPPYIFYYSFKKLYYLIFILFILAFFQPLVSLASADSTEVSGKVSAQPNEKNNLYKYNFYCFGTEISMNIISQNKSESDKGFSAVKEYFEELNTNLNPWTPGELYSLNKAIFTNKEHVVSDNLKYLILEGQKYNESSNTLFEPAVGKLVKLWKFDNAANINRNKPQENRIKEIVDSHPSISQISINGYIASSTNNMVQLDFGGFAKGYATDNAIKILKNIGILNATVNAGGDLKTLGTKFGAPWEIGIANPFGDGAIASIESDKDEAIFTSGNYERNFKKDGKIYHHIIDPKTGNPSIGAVSVTVIDSSGIKADAAATALMVAGKDSWHSVAKSMGIKYVMLIDNNGEVYMNPKMAARVRFNLITPPSITISKEL